VARRIVGLWKYDFVTLSLATGAMPASAPSLRSG
jgi:hypothetical protein